MKSAALLLLVLLTPASAAPLIACADRHPRDVRPRDWAWRTIDGRQCWYRGRQMMPKHQLYWPAPEPEWLRPPDEPEVELRQEPWALEHRWPTGVKAAADK